MLNLNAMNEVADNVIVINGVEIAKLNDTDTTKLISIIKGMTTVGLPSVPASTTTTTESTSDDTVKDYSPREDITVRYFVDKTTSGRYFINYKAITTKKDGTVVDRFKTPRDVKALVKSELKAVKGVKELDNTFVDKNGKNVTYKVYGLAGKASKASYEEIIASLKTVFTVDERVAATK